LFSNLSLGPFFTRHVDPSVARQVGLFLTRHVDPSAARQVGLFFTRHVDPSEARQVGLSLLDTWIPRRNYRCDSTARATFRNVAGRFGIDDSLPCRLVASELSTPFPSLVLSKGKTAFLRCWSFRNLLGKLDSLFRIFIRLLSSASRFGFIDALRACLGGRSFRKARLLFLSSWTPCVRVLAAGRFVRHDYFSCLRGRRAYLGGRSFRKARLLFLSLAGGFGSIVS
jgi:hypothetical protein